MSLFFPKPGDVVLTLGAGRSSDLLVKGQCVLDERATFSHALISIGGDLWCEATPTGGVHLSTTEEAFLKRPPKQASLFRPQPLYKPSLDYEAIKRAFGNATSAVEALASTEIDATTSVQWVRAALYYVGQKYNFLYLLPKPFRDQRKFCSEFVASVLNDLGVPPFCHCKKQASSCTPVDLQIRLAETSWQRLDCEFAQYRRDYSVPKLGMTPDDMRESLTNAMLACTSLIIFSCQVHAAGTRDYIELSRPRRGRLGKLLARQRETLERKIVEGRKFLETISGEEHVQRGAPWMGGQEQHRRLIAAKKELEASLNLAIKVMKKGDRSRSWSSTPHS